MDEGYGPKEPQMRHVRLLMMPHLKWSYAQGADVFHVRDTDMLRRQSDWPFQTHHFVPACVGRKTDSFAGEPTILERLAGELSPIVGPKSMDQMASLAAELAHKFLEGFSYLIFLLQKVDAAPSAIVVGEEYEES